MDDLECISYKIDLMNRFKNGIGIDTIPENEFKDAEQTLEDLKKAKIAEILSSDEKYHPERLNSEGMMYVEPEEMVEKSIEKNKTNEMTQEQKEKGLIEMYKDKKINQTDLENEYEKIEKVINERESENLENQKERY